MKVDLNGLTGPLLDGVSSPQRSPAEPTATSASDNESALGEDTATLSADSTRVKALVAQALSTGSVRQDKIDALRQAIQNGDYQVDAAKIAEAMIEQSQGAPTK